MLNKEKPVKIIIDKEKCTKCGLCIDSCHDYLQKDAEGYPQAKEDSFFGCIQCGYCMMKCPTDAIEIIGEDIDKTHLREISLNLPNYNSINALFLKRRSCRKFKKEEVSKENIDKIISAAATAAVSIPPSEVKVLVIQGRKKVQQFADDIVNELKQFSKIMTPLALNLIKLTKGEAQYKAFKDFVLPLSQMIIEEREKGNDYLFYNAPTVMIFYGSELTDKEDMIIAATHATIAAGSLNLGTCIIGTIEPVLKTPKMKKKYGIQKEEKIGTGFILGVPDETYNKAFQRTFKEVRYIN